MFSSRSFAVYALLTVAAADSAFDLELARENYYRSVLEQCWTEVTDDNYRVVIDVETNDKDELAVALNGSDLIAVRTVYDKFHDALRGKNAISNKLTFTEYRRVPKVVASAATATLTSDGFLVVDLPLDAKVADQTSNYRDVPVVESGKPLEGKRPARPPAKLTPEEGYELVWHMLSSLLKSMYVYLQIETKIEATDNSLRYITKCRNAADVKSKDDMEVFTNAGFVFMSSSSGHVADSHRLPPNSDVDAITAALTSDGYLVVEVPVVEGAAKPAMGVKEVPIEEVGLPLEEMTDNLEIENDDDKKKKKIS